MAVLISRTGTIVYVCNADFAQSLADAQAHAAAWGVGNPVYLEFDFNGVNYARESAPYTSARISCTTTAYSGQTLREAIKNAVAAAPSEVQAIICSTYTPAGFNGNDGATDGYANRPTGRPITPLPVVCGLAPNDFIVTDVARNLGPTRSPWPTPYAGGYDDFGFAVPEDFLARARAQGVYPHGRLGFPLYAGDTVGEQALASGVSGGTITARATAKALLAMAEPNLGKPHCVVPTTSYAVGSATWCPVEENELIRDWLTARGANVRSLPVDWIAESLNADGTNANQETATRAYDNFATYIGSGDGNGGPGASQWYGMDGNSVILDGNHGFIWQSGSAEWAKRFLREGATCWISQIGEPLSTGIPSPSELLYHLVTVRCSMAEAALLAHRVQYHLDDGLSNTWALYHTAYGEPLYAPYAKLEIPTASLGGGLLKVGTSLLRLE